jgi:RNA polymerase sigma-70 factor, ECF subfamily
MPETPVSMLERLRLNPDDETWQQLVDLYAPWLRSWLRRHAVQAADTDDVVQEVFRVVVTRLPDFQHNQQRGAFRHWLRQIMLNSMRDLRRKWQSRPVAAGGNEGGQVLEQLADPASDLSRRWDQEHNEHVSRYFLRQIESKFEPTTCRAFRGVVVEGKKPAAVAAELGISVNAVRLAKSRLLHWLRKVSEGLLE